MTTTLTPTTFSPSTVAPTLRADRGAEPERLPAEREAEPERLPAEREAEPERLPAEREPRRYARAGLVSGAVAAAANLAVFVGARLLDVSLEIRGERFPVFAFPQVTFIGAVLGIAMAAVFARKSRRPRRAFLRTTVALTAVSMVPPVLADADTATKIVLGLTHVIAAAIIIPAIATRLRD